MTPGSSKSVWELQQNLGLLKCANFEARVDLLWPSRGLRQIVFHSQPLKSCVPLQISPHSPPPAAAEELVDCYTRGSDLVAKYAQTPQRSVAPTLYWRHLNLAAPLAGIELLVSMETSLLDSDPKLRSVSQYEGEALWLTRGDDGVNVSEVECNSANDSVWESPSGESGFFLFRLRDYEASYAEMVLPADFQGARLTQTSAGVQLTYELFPESLEKGVIRRGRIRSLFLPRQNDAESAWQVYEDLCADRPPLTT